MLAVPLPKLTYKQRRFARLVAGGHTQVDAYAEVYGGKMTRKTTAEVACREAAKPAVREAIDAYQEAAEPVTDLRKLKQEMLSNLRWLAQSSPDQKVRLAAAIDLRNYADQREERERTLISKSPINVSELLQELESLRAGRAAKTLELEAAEAPAGEADQHEAGEAPE